MTTKNAPRLDSGLIARKGEAAPTVPPLAPASLTPTVQTVSPAAKQPAKGVAGTIAVTVRLDPDRYEKLKLHGARARRTNQDILVEALDLYLEKTGGINA